MLELDGTIYVWYVGGERGSNAAIEQPVIGLARSEDNGVTFEKEPPPVLFPEQGERLASPCVIHFDGRFVMFAAATPTETDGDAEAPPRTTIVRFNSEDGIDWVRVGVVLEPGNDCVNDDLEPAPCWDAGYVREPGARFSRSPAGRAQIDLWYTGGRGDNSGVGFAGSYDGVTFSRYRLNPILDEQSAEAGASVVAIDGGLHLYFSDANGEIDGIALAVQR